MLKADTEVREAGALTLDWAAAAAATVTFAVAVRADASLIVAVMLWLPGVLKITPFVKVWEPASFGVNP